MTAHSVLAAKAASVWTEFHTPISGNKVPASPIPPHPIHDLSGRSFQLLRHAILGLQTLEPLNPSSLA